MSLSYPYEYFTVRIFIFNNTYFVVLVLRGLDGLIFDTCPTPMYYVHSTRLCVAWTRLRIHCDVLFHSTLNVL